MTTEDTKLKQQFIELLTALYKGRREYTSILAEFKKPNTYVTVENACVFLYLWLDPKLLDPKTNPDTKPLLEAFERQVFAPKNTKKPYPHK